MRSTSCTVAGVLFGNAHTSELLIGCDQPPPQGADDSLRHDSLAHTISCLSHVGQEAHCRWREYWTWEPEDMIKIKASSRLNLHIIYYLCI